MPKKKKKHKSRAGTPLHSDQSQPARRPRSMPPAGIQGLREANELILQKRWSEALEALQKLEMRFPDRTEILVLLINTAYELEDIRTYAAACERLLKLAPDDPGILTMLASAYLNLEQGAQAFLTFRRFLERWPDDSRAPEVRETVAAIEPVMEKMTAQLGLSGDEGFAIAALHEKALKLTEQNDFREVRKICSEILRRDPGFVPALNNLSVAYFGEGNLRQAIETAEQAAAKHPGDIHALANLAQFNWLLGRFDEARAWGEQLKQSDEPAMERSATEAIAFTYLGDDEAVLECLQSARASEKMEGIIPLLPHLGAVAALRLGDEKQARSLWGEALKLDPTFDLARDNLDDLAKPAAERHAPWPFEIGNWLPSFPSQSLFVQLREALERANLDDVEAVRRAMVKFLERRPEVLRMMPQLLHRGDPETREFMLKLAEGAHTAETLAILLDFAQSRSGPDDMRQEAAQYVMKTGEVPGEHLRVWLDGQWRELEVRTQKIGFEPHEEIAPELQERLDAAMELIFEQKPGAAEPLLLDLIAEAPDSPAPRFYLAVCYLTQGRIPEGRAQMLKVHQEYPDYRLARAALARIRAEEGDITGAEELIAPLISAPELDIQEYRMLGFAQLEIAFRTKNADLAQALVSMLSELVPDDPVVSTYRRRLAKMLESEQV
ncbi:MAG TPA: tetratricopeptide repeat protein [Armatimonadota bacterium]|nr:tetratricopeptide repeat protein [Armatimonadota bacterium]